MALLTATIFYLRRSDVREACTKKPDETGGQKQPS